jgi:hypothetical protein
MKARDRTQQTGQAGQHYVAAEICRRGAWAATLAGNVSEAAAFKVTAASRASDQAGQHPGYLRPDGTASATPCTSGLPPSACPDLAARVGTVAIGSPGPRNGPRPVFGCSNLSSEQSPLTESNRRPSPYHGDALPTELRGRDRHMSRAADVRPLG